MLYFSLILFLQLASVYGIRPNIVFILADDLGYHDIGYHTPSIHTPNLNSLAYNGVILEQYYTQALCTVSRAALMTSRYPINFGYQRVDTQDECAIGLPLNLTILPEALKDIGYSTHIVGKWHLGFYKTEYLPNNRGFDTFFGYYASSLYHYTHVSYNLRPRPGPYWGLDLHNNSECVASLRGQYASDVFTKEAVRIISKHPDNSSLFLYLPLQLVHTPNEAPEKFRDIYSSTLDTDRQLILAMISAMDESVGKVVQALRAKGPEFWNNTFIVFASDNGGWTKPGSSGVNFPLRGGKFTLFEGGLRVPAFVHSPLLENPRRVEKSLIHVTDWFPTLMRLARGDLSSISGLDGVDQFNLISKGIAHATAPREEILHNIIKVGNSITSSIRVGDWKLMTGQWAQCNVYSNPYFCGWMPPPEFNQTFANSSGQARIRDFSYLSLSDMCDIQDSYFHPLVLYDIENDPNEYFDVSEQNLDIVVNLLSKLREYWLYMSPSLEVGHEWERMAAAAEEYGCLSPWDD